MSRLPANLQGALMMVCAMTAFTVNDAFLKVLGQELPFFQILFLRSVGVVICLALAARHYGALSIAPADRWLVVIRSVAEMGAAMAFITALFHMPIANVSAILQALPLTVTLGAALLFKEPVGWRRFSAIAIGFIGVLLIVRPGTDGFSIYSVYALAAIACVTVRDLAARRLSRQTHTLAVALAAAVGVLTFSGAGLAVGDWKPVNGVQMTYLSASVFFIIGGYIFSVAAMRVGDIGAVAPFRYSALLVALILGLLVFGEWPDMLTMIGAGIVVATGLYTIVRERHARAPATPGLRVR